MPVRDVVRVAKTCASSGVSFSAGNLLQRHVEVAPLACERCGVAEGSRSPAAVVLAISRASGEHRSGAWRGVAGEAFSRCWLCPVAVCSEEQRVEGVQLLEPCVRWALGDVLGVPATSGRRVACSSQAASMAARLRWRVSAVASSVSSSR